MGNRLFSVAAALAYKEHAAAESCEVLRLDLRLSPAAAQELELPAATGPPDQGLVHLMWQFGAQGREVPGGRVPCLPGFKCFWRGCSLINSPVIETRSDSFYERARARPWTNNQ